MCYQAAAAEMNMVTVNVLNFILQILILDFSLSLSDNEGWSLLSDITLNL